MYLCQFSPTTTQLPSRLWWKTPALSSCQECLPLSGSRSTQELSDITESIMIQKNSLNYVSNKALDQVDRLNILDDLFSLIATWLAEVQFGYVLFDEKVHHLGPNTLRWSSGHLVEVHYLVTVGSGQKRGGQGGGQAEFDGHVSGVSQINPDIRVAVYRIVKSMGQEEDHNIMVKIHDDAETQEE